MIRSTMPGIIFLMGVALGPAAATALAGNQCPPPPNPFDLACPLDPDRATLQERDVDHDGLPDNAGQVGGFCGGSSPAQCGEIGSGVQVGLDLIVTNPQTQSVTCSIPDFFGTNINVLIMGADCDGCVATGFGSATVAAGTTIASTLKVVVSDDNGDICPCGGVVTCTFSTEAVCDDGADGDGDGLIDGEDPDCCVDADYDGFCGQQDCDDANPYVQDSPGAPDLRLSIVAGDTRLDWGTQPGSVADVVTGDLTDLHLNEGFAFASCLADDARGDTVLDIRADPLPGQANYYLSRLQNSCGVSGYGPGPGFLPDRTELDLNGPCTADPACDGCVFSGCDLLDPGPVCGADHHCLPLADSSGTTCGGPTGSGTQGDSCFGGGLADCAQGYACVTIGLNTTCAAWCRSNNDCTGFAVCLVPPVPVVLDGPEYGFCFQF